MSRAGQKLTAVRFNSLRNNLKAVRDSGINAVSKGDKVKATYFTTITNTINAAIKNL
jgi:hypothetical protein|nr:MAG TPA: hypothetical protein [Caudoviricetes sp.]